MLFDGISLIYPQLLSNILLCFNNYSQVIHDNFNITLQYTLIHLNKRKNHKYFQELLNSFLNTYVRNAWSLAYNITDLKCILEIGQLCFQANVHAVLYKSTYMDFKNILIVKTLELQDLTHVYNHCHLYNDFTLTRPTEWNVGIYLLQRIYQTSCIKLITEQSI